MQLSKNITGFIRPGMQPRTVISGKLFLQVDIAAALRFQVPPGRLLLQLRRGIFSEAKNGGRDWIRTSDPALIKRML